MEKATRKEKRKRLNDLAFQFLNGCAVIGYLVGVVGIISILYSMGYSLWFAIPVSIPGSLGFGIPIGLLAGLPFVVIFNWVVDLIYADVKQSETKR